METTQLPTDVAGDRVTYAKHQPQYRPVETARQRDSGYNCWRLITAFVPDDEELRTFAELLAAQRIDPRLPFAESLIPALRAAFNAHPVLLSQLSANGVMTPHNLHLGTPLYLAQSQN